MDSRNQKTAAVGPLERVLDQQGRSIAWLAREAGITRVYAWRMIRGQRPLTDDFKAAASRALGVPQDILFPVAAA